VPVFVPAAALAISGGVSLIQQIAWTRILALVIGPTTFAFSAVVATFIAGIALGSLVGGWIARRGPNVWPLAATLLIAALAASGAAAYAPRVPLVVAEAVAQPDAGFAAVVRLQSALIAALMMPMTIAFGAAFPLAVGLAAREDLSVPRDVASVYTANTIGAIAGALTGGFWLVPRFGLEDTVRLAAAIAVAGFALVMLAAHRGTRTTLATGAIASAAIVMIWLLPPWDRELLSSGAYKYAPYLTVEHRDAMLRAGTLLYYREGAAGTVSVRRLTGWISLAIDGKVDASNAGDMLTQKLLAHVPLLLHRSPRRVAVIGLGSGVTAGAALRHQIEAVDTLEISPEVVEASNFFRRENHDALQDRRSRLIVGDGRSHLLLGNATYDVIISEPSNPWMAGVASLFTREFFEAARRRLAPGGILCQWAHTYDISDEDLRSIIATFTSVFPDAALWLVGEGDILLTGSASPIASRVEAMREGWTRPGVAEDLREVDVREVESLLSLYTADGSALGAYAGDAVIQTDDRMALEFSAPRSIYGRTTTNNAATLRALADERLLPDAVRLARSAPQVMVNRGRMELRAEAFPAAFANFARALESRPDDQAAIDGLLQAAAPTGRMAEAEQLIRGIVSSGPRNVPAVVALSRMMAARGDFEAAVGVLRPVFDPVAPDLRVLEQLASVFADAGDQDRLAAIVVDMRRVAPDADATLYYTASHLFLTGRHDQAIAAAERLRARNPRHARCQNLLGAAYASLGRGDRARRAFEASIEADPRDPTTYSNLATFELQSGNPAAAVDRFAEALTLDPSSAGAREGLAQAVAALGQ
jgi:spermidine synthase